MKNQARTTKKVVVGLHFHCQSITRAQQCQPVGKVDDKTTKRGDEAPREMKRMGGGGGGAPAAVSRQKSHCVANSRPITCCRQCCGVLAAFAHTRVRFWFDFVRDNHDVVNVGRVVEACASASLAHLWCGCQRWSLFSHGDAYWLGATGCTALRLGFAFFATAGGSGGGLWSGGSAPRKLKRGCAAAPSATSAIDPCSSRCILRM